MSEWTYHGGRLAAAKLHFDLPDSDWLDLSTGINPHCWPGATDMQIDWQTLPDVGVLEKLEQAAAACFGVDPACVCAVPGTEIGLRLLGSILPAPATYVTPSYRTYAAIFDQARPVSAAEIMTVNDATVVVANPNNPDGLLISPVALLEQLERLRTASQWLVVDEAFADANPEISLTGHVSEAQPLVIFRSFGKFFGLAGTRLGFVIAPRGIIAQYRGKLGSWPVSAAALAIGLAAYRDRDWIIAMRQTLRTNAYALGAVLRRRGYRPIGNCPLFTLIETDNAAALFDHLARSAILTRPFDDNPRWLRLGLPADAEALARLDAALAYG